MIETELSELMEAVEAVGVALRQARDIGPEFHDRIIRKFVDSLAPEDAELLLREVEKQQAQRRGTKE